MQKSIVTCLVYGLVMAACLPGGLDVLANAAPTPPVMKSFRAVRLCHCRIAASNKACSPVSMKASVTPHARYNARTA